MKQLCRILTLISLLVTGLAGEIKNVLFLVSDDLRANALGCYGDKFCRTPHIDKLAAIVFTSDHGYHLGDHSFWQKNDNHEEVTRVPLIIDAAGRRPGRSGSIVELVDLYPTLSELAGLKVPAKAQGRSLVPVLEDPGVEVKQGAISFAKGVSWRTKDWTYIRYKNGGEELYEMRKDPGQITNLAGDPESRAVLDTLSAQLSACLERQEARSR